MLSYSELKNGTLFVLDGDPYIVLEYHFLRKQQRKPVAQTKIRNLRTGKMAERTFHQNESFEEANIQKEPAIYIYESKGEFWFHKKDNKSARFSLAQDIVGDKMKYIVQNTEVTVHIFQDEIINIEIPIKVDLRVTEAPPNVKGNSAGASTKEVVLETGMKLTTPMFIEAGDTVRVNTETNQYIERVEKA